MVTEVLRDAVWRYRANGGRLYRLAYEHNLTPSALSSILTGARRCDYDERLIAVGRTLGVPEDQVFQPRDEAVASS